MRQPDLVAQFAAAGRRVPDQLAANAFELPVAPWFAGEGVGRQLQFAQVSLVLPDDDARFGTGAVSQQLQFEIQVDSRCQRCGMRPDQQAEGCGETRAAAPGSKRRGQDMSSWTMNSRSSPASSLQAAVSVRAMNGSGRINAGTIELPWTSVLTLPGAEDAFRSQTLAV